MLLGSGFSFTGRDFRLDRSVKLQEYCGVHFARYSDPKKTVVLSCLVTADRQLVFVSPHLSVALS